MKYFKNAKVFSNLPVPTTYGATRLDVLVVVGEDCFIGEMKNYKKRLCGELTDRKWLAESNSRIFYIPNPLQQNRHHCIALSSALIKAKVDIKRIKFRDFIVVPNSCVLEIPDSLRPYILNESAWDDMIKDYNDNVSIPMREDLINQLNEWRGV